MKINTPTLRIFALCIFFTSTGFVVIKKKKTKKSPKLVKVIPAKKATLPKTTVSKPYYDTNLLLIVDKSNYELKVYDKEGWLVTYPVVFGNKSLSDKKMEGDRCTPEGTFRIINKAASQKWNKFILFDYPNAESFKKFEQRKRNGEIPQNASIGGSVGIHGTYPDSDFVVDRMINWTEGCVSMKNEDVEELFAMLPIHTKLIIQP